MRRPWLSGYSWRGNTRWCHGSHSRWATPITTSAPCRPKPGSIQDDLGRRADALASYTAAIRILDELHRKHPERVDVSRQLAAAHNNIAKVHAERGNHNLALKAFAEAEAIRRQLARATP